MGVPCADIVDARVTIAERDDAALHVRIVDGDSVRELDVPSCDAAANAVALVLHMLGPRAIPVLQARDAEEPDPRSLTIPSFVFVIPPAPPASSGPAMPSDLDITSGARIRTDGRVGSVIGLQLVRGETTFAVEPNLDPSFGVGPQSASTKISPITGSLIGCLRRDGFGACGVASGGVYRSSLMTVPAAELGVRAEWISPFWSHVAVAIRGQLDVSVAQYAVSSADMQVELWRPDPIIGQIGFAIVAKIP